MRPGLFGRGPARGVSGRLVAEHVERDGRATPAGEATFTLDPDTWADLAVPFQAPPGHVRVTIHVEPVRVPRGRIPNSGDDRGLGLAVKRLWLAR